MLFGFDYFKAKFFVERNGTIVIQLNMSILKHINIKIYLSAIQYLCKITLGLHMSLLVRLGILLRDQINICSSVLKHNLSIKFKVRY